MEDNFILRASKLYKVFPGVRALNGVDFCLKKGEVHALMGENGAGKSTLIKCLTGVYAMDGGEIIFDGKRIEPTSPQHAMQMGISSVYQEVNLCPNLTVAENIFIGRQPMKGVFIDWKTMNERSKNILKRFNIDIDVNRSLDSYSIAIQQMVALARAVDIEAKILILDEPTSSLDKLEVSKLFEIVRKLRDDGMGIVFITHFLDQVYEISDMITVLRNGELVGEFKASDLPKFELVSKMVGKDYDSISNISRAKSSPTDEVVMKLDSVSAAGAIDGISLSLKRGETVGFAGLLGSGRTETAQAMFGLERINAGSIEINGTAVALNSPPSAIKRRIALCPEDRKRDGIIGELTIRENVILALQARNGIFKTINKKAQCELADKYIKLLGIATPDAEKKIGELSGGNQQKVILARWLATEPEVLILDEPTRGIDIGAKAEIMRLTLSLCEDGMAIAFISSELEEVVRLSNRVVVMREGEKIGELPEDDLDQDTILRMIAGGGAA